jgi:FkbM family methyltransferase
LSKLIYTLIIQSMFTKIIRQVTRQYPLYYPIYPLLKFLPDIPDNYGEFAIKNKLKISGYGGGKDVVCKSLFWFGEFAPSVNITLKRLVEPGDTTLDIGANIGATAILLALAVGNQGKVICFEPIPATFDNLESNIRVNNLSQIECHQLALSDSEGIVKMFIPSGQFGKASINIIPTSSENLTEVKKTTFDIWKTQQQKLITTKIALCKIDVEGHESEVLNGMANTLETVVNGGLQIESFVFERHVNPNTVSDPVFDYLASYGYRVFRIDKRLKSIVYSPLGVKPIGQPTDDFVAIIPGSMGEGKIGPWIVS